jgi:hypothetical protein
MVIFKNPQVKCGCAPSKRVIQPTAKGATETCTQSKEAEICMRIGKYFRVIELLTCWPYLDKGLSVF